MHIEINDEMIDDIVTRSLIESYRTAVDSIRHLQGLETIKPHQQEDLDYDLRYVDSLYTVLLHWTAEISREREEIEDIKARLNVN